MLRALGALGPLLAAAILGTDRRISRQLREGRALEPANAVAIADDSPLLRWRLSRLIAVGAVQHDGAGRYFLNEERWRRYRRRRRQRALVILGAALLAALLYNL